MTNEELKDFIINYIENNKLKSAIMINGPWGSGKSYYIDNTLIPYLKKNNDYDIVKVSVYGLKEISELTRQIYYEIRIGKLRNKKEVISGGKILIKGILSGIASFFNIDPKISDNDLQKLYSSVNLKNKLIVIEDLERTDIDLVKLLGFINNLTELDGAKVLLVANESEIVKPKITMNPETKKFEQHYSEKAEEYLHIKEKTVSDTLLFNLDFDSSINGIVAMFDNFCLTKIFEDCEFKEQVFKKIRSSQHENLRTVIFAFQKFVDIIKVVDFEDEDLIIYKKIILILFDICISLKKGKLDKSDLDIISKIDKKYKGTPYYFVCQYILYQKINKASVINGIADIKNEEKLLSENKYDEDIQIIQCFTRSDDNELMVSINSIINKLENNSLGFYNYGVLASYIIYLSSFLNFDVEKIKQLMLKNLKECKSIDNAKYWFLSGIQQPTEEKINEYISFKQDIMDILSSNKLSNIEESLNNIIKASDRFIDFCYENKNKFLNEHKFFGYINIKDFVKIMKNAKPVDITNYRNAFGCVYDFSNISEFYKDDIPNLVECVEQLKSLNVNNFSKTKTLVFNWLINDLNGYANKLGYVNKT